MSTINLSNLLDNSYVGFTGSQGAGFTGSRGDIGFTGSRGNTGFTGSIGFTGSKGTLGWVTKTANYTSVNLDAIIADTGSGAFTITLPATPSAGDTVVISDGNDFSTNNLTIARNGSTIEDVADDFVLDIQHVKVDFVYDGSTWQVFPTISSAAKPSQDTESFATISSSAGSLIVNTSIGNVFSLTLTENITSTTFSNAPDSGTAYGMTIKVVQDATARTIAWPTSVDWPSATAPTISSGSGEVDVFVFYTHDGGTTWYGFVAGQDLS
jgi:hypothetical protein